MAKFDVTIDKRKLVPSFWFIAKLTIFAILTHFLIIPLIFQTFTFFGELRSLWQVVATVIISSYLARLIKLRYNGREYF